MGMQQLKGELEELVSFDDFSSVLKSMASIKYPRFKKQLDGFRVFAENVKEKFKKELEGISTHLDIEEGLKKHGLESFFETSTNANSLIIVVTGNLGFCGKYNREILNLADELIAKLTKPRVNLDIICVGKKACDYFSAKRHVSSEGLIPFPEKSEEEKVGLSNSLLKNRILEPFLKKEISNVKIVYQSFTESDNKITTKPETFELLPIPRFEIKTGIMERKTVFEPSPILCLCYLIRESLVTSLMNCFIEAETAENYSRMIAMNQASESIKEMLSKKESEIRRFRQALITKELVEIISGAEALKSRDN